MKCREENQEVTEGVGILIGNWREQLRESIGDLKVDNNPGI